jgi:hypothetical protein
MMFKKIIAGYDGMNDCYIVKKQSVPRSLLMNAIFLFWVHLLRAVRYLLRH